MMWLVCAGYDKFVLMNAQLHWLNVRLEMIQILVSYYVLMLRHFLKQIILWVGKEFKKKRNPN